MLRLQVRCTDPGGALSTVATTTAAVLMPPSADHAPVRNYSTAAWSTVRLPMAPGTPAKSNSPSTFIPAPATTRIEAAEGLRLEAAAREETAAPDMRVLLHRVRKRPLAQPSPRSPSTLSRPPRTSTVVEEAVAVAVDEGPEEAEVEVAATATLLKPHKPPRASGSE